ncbi:MAG: tRNA (guanosine(46)-N7)-methyltransferase TrmB [Cyclobacteriaceae bacterium]
MGKKNKLGKFSDNRQSKNVIEYGKPEFEKIKGNWSSHFKNENELTIELACGWGEYTVSLAEKFPAKNFIGIDIKGDRIWKGSQYARENNLYNVAFLRTYINLLGDHFSEGEVDEIWLTFPDPRPKDRDEKHRLSNLTYLNLYKKILKKDGWFRFKTDSTFLFDYTLRIISDQDISDFKFTTDLYQSDLLEDHHGVRTKYERIWTERGEKIKYMKFRFA